MTEQEQTYIFSTNLKRLLEERDLSQKKVAEEIGVIPQTFNRWVQGLSIPRMDKIQKLADYFNVRKSTLIDQIPIQDETGKAKQPLHLHDRHTTAVRIPVYGRVAAGIPLEAIEDIIDWEEIPEELARSGEYFGLLIEGNSMEPRICNHDVVIVRQQPDAESGDIVIALIDGQDAVCKRLRKYLDGTIELVSANPSYDTLVFSKDEQEKTPVSIIGKVVELRGKL